MQTFMKTILSAFQTWTKKEIKNSTADWNQNDSNADNYIKNRPFWTEYPGVTLVPEQTYTVSEDEDCVTLREDCPVLISGRTYIVVLNGVTYECVARLYNDSDALLGNGTIYGDDDPSNNEPFSIDSYNDGYIYLNVSEAGEYTISITEKLQVHTIDEKYLPDRYTPIDEFYSTMDEIGDRINSNIGPIEANIRLIENKIESVEDKTQNTLSIASNLTTLPVTASWNQPIYVNGKFIVTSSEMTAYSEDGITWTGTTLSPNKLWDQSIYADGKFILAPSTESNIAAYSEDGITWIETALPSAQSWSTLIYGNGKFLLAPYTTSNMIVCSEDGINWIETTLPFSHHRERTLVYGDGKFIAIPYGKSNKAAYSEDGINWIEIALPSERQWYTPIYGGGKFIVRSADIIAYSEDGITWIETTLPVNQGYGWGIPIYANGKFIVTPDGSITSSNIAAYSEDGITWIETTLPVSQRWRTPVYADGKFIVIPKESSNIAACSEDGINWIEATLPVNQFWDELSYGNGKFIVMPHEVITYSNIAAYSEDGINWIETTLPGSQRWRASVYGGGKFIEVPRDTSDKVFYSEDGITWKQTTGDYIEQNGADVTNDVKEALNIDKLVYELIEDIPDASYKYYVTIDLTNMSCDATINSIEKALAADKQIIAKIIFSNSSALEHYQISYQNVYYKKQEDIAPTLGFQCNIINNNQYYTTIFLIPQNETYIASYEGNFT